MKKYIILSIALTFMVMLSKAQKNVYFTITHKLATSNFAFEQTVQNDLMQNFKITRVDYYISGIKIIHDGGLEKAVPNKYILAKGSANVMEFLGSFNVTSVEGIKFSIGIEAPTNNADPSLQPTGSPLYYQSPSMHWGWNSGYRFLALEGTTGTGFATTFQMHGLGNTNYFSQTKMVAGMLRGANDIFINLNADYIKALKGINVSSGPMDHGADATDLIALQNFRDYVFSAGTEIPLPVEDMDKKLALSIYPNPAKDKLYVSFDNNKNKIDKIVITDITGKMIIQQNTPANNEINVDNFPKGFYIIRFFNGDSNVANRKIVIQ
jgi:hypothetical protein